MGNLSAGNLVLYKNRPARVVQVNKKIEIELQNGNLAKVRPKDVAMLHVGPIQSLTDLQPCEDEVEVAWELLAGSRVTLTELAELIYGEHTPSTAWATWQLVDDGLYFRGAPDEVIVCTSEEVEEERAAREAAAAEKRAWEDFITRVRAGQIVPQDERYLSDVEALALKQHDHSRVLRELGHSQTPENAHALLLKLGYWDETVNPYPRRLELNTAPVALELPELPDERRVDLTHLAAFAIDDDETATPDDALSLDGNRLWVHIADPAALIPPDSKIDLEARARVASIHMPERVVQMLPEIAADKLGLGLTELSPALSFALELDDAGQIVDLDMAPSWVRVTRLTYNEVETRLEEEPFKQFYRLAEIYCERRRANGAVFIELPEVKIMLRDGEIALRPIHPLKSRMLVQEAMLMVGEAVARFALEYTIPIPFTTQEPSSMEKQPETLAEMVALRRTLRRSQYSNTPALHAGVGLDGYVQATSPLRRYLDLVVHQQLRAYLRGAEMLGTQEIMERVGATEAVAGNVRYVERLSDKHWTLVYLLRHPDWRGEGVVVEKRNSGSRVLIPELGLEMLVHSREDLPLDSRVNLVLDEVDLPQLEAHFRVE